MKRIRIVIETVMTGIPKNRADLVISVEDPLSKATGKVISRGSFYAGDTLTLWVSALPETAQIVVTPRPPPRLWIDQKRTIRDAIKDSWDDIVVWWWSIVPYLEDPDG